VETVKHFLLDCPQYIQERHTLRHKLRRNAGSISFLLSNPSAVLPILKFVHSTGRFKAFFGGGGEVEANSCETAELRTASMLA
jgi:hypothetical protein